MAERRAAAAEAKALEAAAEAKALEAAAEAPASAAETVEAAKTAVEIAAPKGLFDNPEYWALMKEYEDCILHGINPSRERTMEVFYKLSKFWLEARAAETPAQVAETPAQVAETPAQVVEAAAQVVEAAAEVAETPAQVVEAAAEVAEAAKTAVESAAAGQPQDPATMSCLELIRWYFDLKGSKEPFWSQMTWCKRLTECYERREATPKTPAEAPAEADNLAETAVETSAAAVEAPVPAAAPAETPAEVVEVAKTAVESTAAVAQRAGHGPQKEVDFHQCLGDHSCSKSAWLEHLREAHDRFNKGQPPRRPETSTVDAATEAANGTAEALVEKPSAVAPEAAAKVVEVAKTSVESAEAATPEAAEVLEQWCHRTEVSGHELPPGTAGPALESMAEIYQVYGFELGSLLLISLGILVQLLQLVLVGLMKLLGNNPRYPTEERVPSSGYECGFSPFAAISSSSLVVFRQLAVYFVVFEAELVFLYPWSASLLPGSLLGSALGYYGVVPFLACLVVGFALEIQRDALKL
jgi:NADH:ubiquinone oxidoreductase subunit 3 (subunit A)